MGKVEIKLAEKVNPLLLLTQEQLNALTASFYPAMVRFFNSERGKKIYEDYLKKQENEKMDTH